MNAQPQATASGQHATAQSIPERRSEAFGSQQNRNAEILNAQIYEKLHTYGNKFRNLARKNFLALTAAYAAVLVVFVSTSMAPVS